MGNTDSTSAENDFTPLFHGKELKWKTGPLDTSIPINESYDVIDTYEKLKTSKKFKEYMLQHIDSDELIRSLLSNDSDEAALEGITSYNSPKPEDVETIAKEAKNLENCSNAGIKLKLSEVLQLLERQLGSSFQLERLPFLISIQRRLAVFRELHAAVSHERKSLVCSEKQRKWSKKSLNSIDHPSLSALSAFTDFGAEILDFIPLLVESLKDQEQVGNAVRPLINLCNKFSECEDLCFFSSWSPRVEPPLKSINLSKCVVNASRGDALLAIDGIANTRWSSEGGEWSITFASPEEIDRIRIAWVNPEGKILDQFGIGAPEKLSIFAVYEEQKEVSKPSFVTIIEPEKQKILQGSWIQYYKLNLKNVKKLILYPSKKICASSTATSTEIFDFSAFNTDQNITWIDNLKLFSKIQRSFFSSMKIRSIESEALNANLGVLRGTGSLGLCLSFVEHFLQATPLAILTYDPFSALLKAISHKEDEVVKKFNRRNCKFVNEELNDCQFSTTKRSSNIVVHSKTEISIGNESGFCCIDTRLSLIFSEYSYDWEFQVTEGKGIRFGVTELSGSNPATLDKSWLVDLDGNLYIKSANSSSKLQVSRTQATNFRFLFIAKSRQLSLWIDEEYFGVIFEQIQGVVHPVVFFEAVEDHRSISLSKFVQIINPNSTVPTLSSSELTSFPLESTVNFAAELLDTISKLAEKLNLTLIYTDETESKQFLEYPFCAEVSFDLFGKLARVLSLLLDQNDDIGVQSLLKILELQFHILSKSNLRLASVESFFNEDVNENERENILQDLQLYLNRLTGSSNDSLAASATLTYSRGLRTFSKDNSEWLQKVVDLFERKSSLSYQLWGILLEGFDDLNTIKVLLDSLNDYDSKNLQRLTSQIINQVVNVELGMIKEKETCTSDKSEFLSISKSFLLFLLEELTVRIASNVDLKEITFADEVFIHLTKEMFLSSFQLLKSERVRAVSSWEHDLLLRQSFICNTLHSLIYVFSIETVPLKILELIIDDIQSFVLQMSELTNSSDICRHSLESVSSSIIRKRTHTSTGSSVGGWKVVKAIFEDADSSFTISDNGTTYTSLHSSNTCALVNYRFGVHQRGAWEFILDTDSVSDECSVFGAARQPLRSRCYSSSNDLWMRRSYNGYMYNQGSTTGNNMDKIHPGDTIRIEFNGPEGTLSYSVNGGEMEVGFTDITDDIYPACGSYRNGVIIKLIKVEIFNNQAENDGDIDIEDFVPAKFIQWSLTEPLVNMKDVTILQLNQPKDKKSKKSKKSKWLSARGNKGAAYGVHDWEFQFGSFVDGPWSIGFTFNETPVDSVRLASEKGVNGAAPRCYSWNSDGSLWSDGSKLSASFGTSFFPIKKNTTVKLRINRIDQTASFFVNGNYVGISFGPENFNPAVVLPLPEVSGSSEFRSNIIYPAASIYDAQMSIKIRSAGMESSVVLPLLASLTHSAASILGRVSARMIQGISVDVNEKDLTEWLRSAIFSGGIDSSFLDSSKLEALPANSLSELQTKISELSNDDQDSRDLTDAEKFILEIAHGYNLNQTDSSVSQFYEWLEKIDAEPVAMRKAFEKTGNYRFPNCELPFIACLIKHAGLIEEAFIVLHCIVRGESVTPSEELFLLWQKVKQLRSNLRRKRQQFKAQSVAISQTKVVDDSSSKSAADGNHDENSSDIKSSDTLSSDPLQNFHLTDSIQWLKDLELLVENQSLGAKTTVKSFGLDTKNLSIFILVDVSMTAVDKKLPTLTNGSLKIGEEAVDELLVFSEDSTATTSIALLMFDLSRIEISKILELESVTYRVGEGWDPFTVSLKGLKRKDEISEDISDFDSLCNSIAAKSQFLLLMKSAWQSTDASSKSTLLGLSSLYLQRSNSIKTKDDQSRWRTQERWKRVIEFLHVNSKIRRQLSTESESNTAAQTDITGDVSSLDAERDQIEAGKVLPLQSKEEVSTAQAAIQASSIFVNSEDSLCSAENLYRLMKTRLQRANNRIKALKILRSTINNTSIVRDPLLLFEILVVVKNCVPPNNGKKNKFSEQERSHYLINLEGCSASVLKSVQNAFASLYAGLSDIFTSYLQLWDQSSLHSIQHPLDQYSFGSIAPPHLIFQGLLMVLKMWTIQFSNRDYGWIVESSILPALFKVVSLSFHEKLVLQWFNLANSLLLLDPMALKKENLSEVKLYGKESVFNGIMNGSVTGRGLLFNLHHYALFSNHSRAELEQVGLGHSFTEGLNYINILENSSKIFCHLTSINEEKIDAVESAKKAEAAEKEAEEAKKLKEELTRLAPAGIFDPDCHATEIKLSDFNSIATLREDRSGTSICAYVSVDYDLNNPGDHGNYFELTIISVGQGDVGVGFADKKVFNVRDNMPGWIAHSYGYHGDDGKKYGEHSTPGDYPVFEEGDVIGCGIRFDTKTIFYTRNGTLLGDGFTEIEESTVTPIVGFSNRHDDTVKVKINFGVEPFVYNGSEIVTNQKALEERRNRESSASNLASTRQEESDGNKSELSRAPLETVKSIDLSVANVKDIYTKSLASLQAVESQLFEHGIIREASFLLVRYFLTLSAETHLESIEPKKETILSVHRPPLLKDVSTFGTPKAVTKVDESKIQSEISAALVHELFIGSQYVNQGRKTGGRFAHSFAFFEEKLLNYDFSDPQHDVALLEVSEVVHVLRQHLTTLCIVVGSSEDIRKELTHTNSLKTLLTLLLFPAASVYNIVVSILLKVLPETDPDTVEDSMPSEWREKLNYFDSCLLDWKCGKRTRKMPDSFIRVLLLESTSIFRRGSDHLSSFESVYGYGEEQFRKVQLNFRLLQKLFATPAWTELVAANVGNAFKNAASLMIDDDIWMAEHAHVKGGELILFYAAVSCGSIYNLPLLVPGMKVEISNSTGLVVGGFGSGNQVDVIFDANLKEFLFGKHIESVERDQIRFKTETTEIDFTTISHPVLPNLFSLTKQLLTWMLQNQANSFPQNDTLSLTKVNVLGILLSTILTLINSQTEVVMENLQDTNILKELLLLSASPINFPKIINYSDSLNLWIFTQCRRLECEDEVLELSSSKNLARQVSLSRQISAEKGRAESVDTTDLPPSDSTFVEISSEARKSTEEVAARLAEEFSFPKEFCQACLEYAMLDEVKARELLQSSKSVSFADVTETVQTKATSIASELSDESLVKGIQHVHSLSAEGYPSSDSILYYFKVEGIEGKKNDNDKEESYILEGSEEGLVKYNFTNVGMSKVTTDTSCIVTRYYNSANGNVYYKLLPKSGCSRILSFHHPLAINYKESPFPVFWTLAILSGRSLTKSLLLSGYSYILKLTEESNSSTPNNLIKFISSTDSSGIGSSLSSICNALPERNAQSASSSFGEESLITSLIEDAKKQLKDSCEVELNQQSSSEDSAKEFFRVSSPHPFRGPFQTSGEIIFPKAWRGATLSFNKKCRTPTDKARLKFYETKEDAVGDKFLYSFSGEHNPSKDFRDITFTDCKSVFYKFEVLPGGDKFPMKAKQFCGLTSYSEEVRVFKITGKVDSSKPVGLGEEDSLFNLFDLSASEQPVTEKSFATIVADSPAVSSGCWRFEVIIRSATEDLGQADHFFRVGVKEADITSDGDDFVVGDKDGTCGIGNDLATYANQQGVATSNRQINWSQDIVIDVVVEAVEENYTIAFLHDNQFINLWTGEKVGKGIIPAITFSNSCKVAVNFGDLPFRFQEFGLEEGIFSSPILPFVDSIGEEKQNDIAWGYDFVVKPLMSLNLQLNRDFELIWQPKGEESSSGSSKVDYTKRIWIWRSKSVKDYVNISDIVTTTPYPPRRSVLVFKHQCKSPKSFNLVFSSSKNNLFIWRPNPEDGYVAMGDVATTSSSSPPTSCVACLPRWAVKEAEVIQSLTVFKKVGDGKTSTNASVWKVDNNYGFFFGSPYEKRTSAEPRHTDFKCDGVGSGYTLVSDVESVVSAEWRKESEILSQPSVLWSQQLIHGLLTSEKWHQMALNDSVFKALVNYLRSSTAAAPLEVVPTIILMVRQANKYSIPLSFHEMKTLCHVILKEAVDLVKTQKKTEIPKSLMRLVDLVVEIQITNVLESGLKDRSTISRNIERGKFKLDWFEETKEEVNIIEEKEGDILDNSFASTKVVSKSAKWWDRSNLDHHALKLHRVMKKDSVVHLIDGSETVLMKLKQALKFLFAVGSSENSLEHSISTPKIERSFPKLMTSKIWYETISLCQFIQSTHPYRAKNFVKKVSFPGVQQLSVQFDRRCSLNPGDKLTLSSGTHNYVLSSSMNENYLKKGVEFISNEVTITFEAGCTEKDTHEWGWAFIIFTSGPVYESADTTIDLESLVENVAGSSSANLNIKDDYSIEDAVERLKSLKLTDIDLDVTSEEPLKGNATETSEKIKKIDANGHDSDSEESGVIDATEDGGKATSQIEVGIDSTELYQAEGELARPKSKRGRRPKVKFEEETKDKEKTVSEEKKAEEEEEVDPTLDIIEFLGQLRHSDFISVPHSKELEIKIERSTADPNPSEDSSAPTRSTDYSYLLKIIGEVEGTVTTRILLAANESRTLKVPGSTANYELFSIATERLEQIIDAIKRKAEEAKRVERGEVEKAEDIPVVEEVQVQEQVKPAAPEIDWQSLIGWNCSLCTYFNTNDHTTCEMCGTANQVLAAADPTASTVAESTTTSGEAVAGWWCPVCTLVNPLRATSCQACGTARVTGEDSTERADEKPKKEEEEELLLSPSISDIVVSKPSAISSSLTTGDIVKISVKGKFDIIGKFESRLEAAVVSGGKILTPLQVHHRLSSWNRECDEALIEYMNNHKKESTTNTTKAQPFSFILPKQYLLYQGQSLSRLTMIDIIMRTQMIEAFNKTLETLLPLIDLGNDDPHSLGAMIRKSNRYLLMKIKSPLLEKAINSTSANNATVPSSDAPATLMLDNFKSLLSRERGEKDITISQNCFVQAFKQLQKKDSAVYRYIISGDRCFTISFADESGIDAGGVFREGISRIIEDLFSEHFHLLLLCPNGQQVVHSNMDKYVPNPKYITPLALDMFEFIGKLMAMSIRAKLYLPFEFPPLIWKKIVGEEVNKYDLMEIDMITSRQLDEIEFCHKEQLNTTTTTTSENNNGLFNEPITNQETFYNKYQGKLKFVYIGSDSIEKDLILNGHLKEVTFENRFEYCDLVRKTRLNEFDVQIAAIARGMGQVIPMRALLLFSAKQLEELVCGNAKIDIDVWKQNTEVSGVSSTTVNLFWKVMESLTVQEQTGFVRFAWGRSRLPSKSEDFQMKMRLTSGGRAALPVSHTCFFSVELPEYRTEEEMRHGLLTAIHYGVGGILNG